jgi:hypothetical protein
MIGNDQQNSIVNEHLQVDMYAKSKLERLSTDSVGRTSSTSNFCDSRIKRTKGSLAAEMLWRMRSGRFCSATFPVTTEVETTGSVGVSTAPTSMATAKVNLCFIRLMLKRLAAS